MRDYPVRRRSRDEIRRLATDLRRQLGVFGTASVDMLSVFESRISTIGGKFAKLEVIRQAASLMNGVPAYTQYTSQGRIRLFLEDAIYTSAANGSPLAGKILAHELGHVVLHSGQPKAFLAGNYKELSYTGNEECSAEWQADEFQLGFQLPDTIISQFKCVESLVKNCNVSYEDAENAIEIYKRTTATRSEHEAYTAYKRDWICQANLQADNLPDNAVTAWRTLRSTAEYDSEKYRLCPKGFLVCRDEFKKLTPYGWKIDFGVVVSCFNSIP